LIRVIIKILPEYIRARVRPVDSPFPKTKDVIIANKWHSKRDMNPPTTRVRTWSETLEMLKGEHGDNAKAAVYPYCALQIPPFPPGI
jgi:hypothetical protein